MEQRKKLGHIPVSDKMTDEDEARIFRMGFFDYIPKPLKEITLILRIERALGHCKSGGLPAVED
jgi:DNA-binding response OmpR family regulator